MVRVFKKIVSFSINFWIYNYFCTASNISLSYFKRWWAATMNVFIFFAFDSLFIYMKSNVFCLHRLSMKILVLYFDREFIFIFFCIYLFVLFESNTSVCLHNKSRFIVHSLIFLLFFFSLFVILKFQAKEILLSFKITFIHYMKRKISSRRKHWA